MSFGKAKKQNNKIHIGSRAFDVFLIVFIMFAVPLGTAKHAKNATKHIRNTTAFHALKPDLAFAAAFISAAAVEFMLISVTVALSWK